MWWIRKLIESAAALIALFKLWSTLCGLNFQIAALPETSSSLRDKISATLQKCVINDKQLEKCSLSAETDTVSEKKAVTRYGHWVWKGDEPQQENKKTGSRGEQQ